MVVAASSAIRATNLMELGRSKLRQKKVRACPHATLPLFISTNPSHINPHQLRDLYASSNLSSHHPPIVGSDGRVEFIDFRKLRIALSHSSVVVSVFCKSHNVTSSTQSWLPRMLPVTHSNGQLVGFGRAVTDNALTASIYDVMVIPSLRGMGIGRMIVKRLVRTLTSRDIYDIVALCSENERLFFEACGFGDDVLGSTTMIYRRTIQ